MISHHMIYDFLYERERKRERERERERVVIYRQKATAVMNGNDLEIGDEKGGEKDNKDK